MDTLGKRIARYRKAAKMSQASLAKSCGWSSQSRVGNYESGTREPTLADLEKIASAVGVSVAELVYGESVAALAQPDRPEQAEKTEVGDEQRIRKYQDAKYEKATPELRHAVDDLADRMLGMSEEQALKLKQAMDLLMPKDDRPKD